MYLWKTWHDSRTRVVVYILAALSMGLLSGLDVVTWANWHTLWLTLERPMHARSYWDFYGELTFDLLRWRVIGYGEVAALLAGLSLGASGVGREYGAGTMHFVLTRPRARRSFVFTDWMTGLTAMVIVVGALAYGVLPFLWLAHAQGPGNILIGLPGLWALGAAIFGLASFTTLVAGSAPKGLVLSVAGVLTYFFLPTALYEWWHMDTLIKAQGWTLQILSRDSYHFHWSVTAFWLAAAASFLGASLLWIKFREV
jgi:ABC-type transport system involved in multi-copper enzyme maturation permease subunit